MLSFHHEMKTKYAQPSSYDVITYLPKKDSLETTAMGIKSTEQAAIQCSKQQLNERCASTHSTPVLTNS